MLPFRLVDAFTEVPFQGSRAGVVLDAEGLSDAACLAIAREVQASETAFVEARAGAGFRVRFFTVAEEVPLCGHATLATFAVLAEEGRLVVGPDGVARTQMECGAGQLPIEARRAGGRWRVRQRHLLPTVKPCAVPRREIAALHGLREEDLLRDLPVEIVSTGLPFLEIPLLDASGLARAKPEPGLAELQRSLGLSGSSLFTLDAPTGFRAEVRVFCEAVGIAEDPATGTNAGALACYFSRHGLVQPRHGAAQLAFLQGMAVGRRCELFTELHFRAERELEAVFIDGAGVITVRGEMLRPNA